MKLLGVSLAALVALGSAFAWMDSRWVSATEFDAHQVMVDAHITQNTIEAAITRLSIAVATLELRVAGVRDKIYEGAVKTNKTLADEAVAERYRSELKDAEGQLRDKRKRIDELKTE